MCKSNVYHAYEMNTFLKEIETSSLLILFLRIMFVGNKLPPEQCLNLPQCWSHKNISSLARD